MPENNGMLPKQFFKYQTLVLDYVNTGEISSDRSKENLICDIQSLSEDQRKNLKAVIQYELPMDSWADHGPLLESMPKIILLSILSGLSMGGAMLFYAYLHQEMSEELKASVAVGVATSVLSFFVQKQNKIGQIHNSLHFKTRRGQEFIDVIDDAINIGKYVKNRN